MTRIRNEKMDNVKAILILLVVIGHFVENAAKQTGVTKSIFLFIYSFHMPLFIFVSGYFCVNTVKDKNRTWKKVQTFLLYYLALKILIFIVQAVMRGSASFHLLEENGIPWYLFVMAIYYPVVYSIRNLNKKHILIIAFVLGIMVGYDKSIGDYLVLSRAIVYFPFFLLGWMCSEARIGEKYEKKIESIGAKIGATLIVLAAIGVCIKYIDQIYFLRPIFTGRNSYAVLEDAYLYGAVCRVITYICSLLLGLAVYVLAPRKAISILGFDKLGERTLQIYFWHRPILYVLQDLNVHAYLIDKMGWQMALLMWLLCGVLLTYVLAIPFFGKPLIEFRCNKGNRNADSHHQ